MEANVTRIRDFVRRKLSGERVWRIGISVTPQNVRVTLYTPGKTERLTDEREKERPAIADEIERKLKNDLGRDVKVEVVQSPMAVAKYIRITPRKVRFVVDAIRGKHVQDALAILQFVPNSAAKTVSKLIKSAMANAEENHRMDAESLAVIHVHVDEGPSLKRISPRAMGRAYRIVKRTSHITVGLGEAEKPAKIASRGKGVARTVAKAPRRGAKAEGAAAKLKRAPKEEKTTAKAVESPEKVAKTKAPRKPRAPRGGD